METLNATTVNILLSIDMGMTISELKKKVKKESYVSMIIANLIELGLIDVIRDNVDARTKIIYFTEKGLLIKLLYGYIGDLLKVKNVVL